MYKQIYRPIQRENVHLHTDKYYYSLSAVYNNAGGNHLTLALHLSKQYVSKHVIIFHFSSLEDQRDAVLSSLYLFYCQDCLELHLVGHLNKHTYDARKYEHKKYSIFFRLLLYSTLYI